MSNRIFFINPTFYRKEGTATQANEMLRSLQNIGADVVVFPPLPAQRPAVVKPTSVPARLGLPDGIRRSLRSVRRLWSKFQAAWNAGRDFKRSVNELKEAMNSANADVVLARLELLNLKLLSAISDWKRPMILLVDAALFHEVTRVRSDSLSSREMEMERKLWKVADAIIVLSTGLAEMIAEQGIDPGKIHVNPLGVDPNRFHPDVDGSAIRQRYSLSAQKVVGYVGKLSKIHDLDTLIEAFVLVCNGYKGLLKLLIVGDGPERSHLDALVQQKGLADSVIFTGYVNYEQIPAHIAAMDVVTTPLHKENIIYSSPLKMFEYMAMAKPIVMPRGGQVSEILVDGDTALLVEPESAQEMADAILRILNDPQAGLEMGQRAREFVRQNYTWEMNAIRVVQVCQNFVDD